MFPRVNKKYLLAFICLFMSYLLLKQCTIHHRRVSPRRANVLSSKPQWCQFPKLDIKDPSVMQFYSVHQPLECWKKEKNWVYIRNGTFYIDSEAEVRHRGNITCDYREIQYLTELTVDMKPKEKFQNGSKLKGDFFKVDCQVDGTNVTYSNYHAGVVRLENVIERSKSKSMPPNALGLNVYMLGFDSTSRLAFMRNLPKMYKYLTEKMDAIVLEGYNIVGDGTCQVLIPILTGRKEEEWPSTKKGDPNASFVDDAYKFIWNEYRNAGYVTLWGEDNGADLGTFMHRMKGFRKQPTDHYMRIFYTATNNSFQETCMGSQAHHNVFFDYVQHFWETYPIDTPKFAFQFHSVYSHDDFSMVQYADDYMVDHLKFFVDNGYWNNTIIIAMTDHGYRYGRVRTTAQGKLEERLPFFSFVFPPWFKNRYPETIRVFKENAARLTTPLDIYPTLQEILNFNPDARPSPFMNRSLSLFHPIPSNRTCDQAGIYVYWCTCLEWTEVPIKNSIVQLVASDLVKTINEKTQRYRDLCAQIKISKIEKALIYTPSTELLKVMGTSMEIDEYGFIPELSHKPAEFNFQYYQLVVWTEPGNAHYEASITWNTATKKSTIDLSLVSHINRYEDKPHCIIEKAPGLVKFCKCYDKI